MLTGPAHAADTAVEIAELAAANPTAEKFGNVVAIDGDTIVVGTDDFMSTAGKATVFEKTGDTVKQVAILTASSGSDGGSLGRSVAVSGDTIVLGAPGANNDFGAAYVYVKPAGGWVDATESGVLQLQEYANCGQGVAVSGNTVAMGCPAAAEAVGKIVVFAKPDTGWGSPTVTAELTLSDGTAGDNLGGQALALSDDIVVAGVPNANNSNGKVYVWTKPDAGWANADQTAALETTDVAANLGSSVGVSGDTIVSGMPFGNGEIGQAAVFVQPAGGWVNATSPTATLKPSDGVVGDGFGQSTAISGDAVIVGAPMRNAVAGGIYSFDKPAGGWVDGTQSGVHTPKNSAPGTAFGYSAAISGATFVAGAPGAAQFEGRAYVFGAPKPTPPPPPPTGKKVQKPADAKGKPPVRIKKSGLTVITGRNARTNAGQVIRTRISGNATAQGEVRYYRVIRGPKGFVALRTYGKPGLKVVVVQSAPSTSAYKAYRKRTVYVNGAQR